MKNTPSVARITVASLTLLVGFTFYQALKPSVLSASANQDCEAVWHEMTDHNPGARTVRSIPDIIPDTHKDWLIPDPENNWELIYSRYISAAYGFKRNPSETSAHYLVAFDRLISCSEGRHFDHPLDYVQAAYQSVRDRHPESRRQELLDRAYPYLGQ